MLLPIDEIGFFNPIESSGQPNSFERQVWLGRIVEWYFDWGQQAYTALAGYAGDHIVPVEEKTAEDRSFCSQVFRIVVIAIKILSCLTVGLPLAMLFGKMVYRGQNEFLIQERPTAEQIEKFLENAKTTIQGLKDLKANEISLATVDEIKQLFSIIKKLENQQSEFQDILNHHSAFFSEKQCDEIGKALEEFEDYFCHIGEKIYENRNFARENIIKIYDQLRLPIKSIKNDFTTEMMILNELQTIEIFITQFQEDLGVYKKSEEGSWIVRPEPDQINAVEIPLLVDDFHLDFSRKIRPKGIVNLGASCFMNASLQAIIANPFFRTKIKEEHQPIYDTLQENLRKKLESFKIFDNAAEITHTLFNAWHQLKLSDLVAISSQDKCDAPKSESLVSKNQPTSDEQLENYILRTFPNECSILLGNKKETDSAQVKTNLSCITTGLKDYIKYRTVMETLRKFVLKYEEPNVKAWDFQALVIELRKAFHDARCLDGSLEAQHDPLPLIGYVLEAIGYAVPITMTRRGGANGDGHVDKQSVPFQIIPVSIKNHNSSKLSLQNLMNDYMATSVEQTNWIFTNDKEVLATYTEMTERQSIDGDPPKYLQVYLKRYHFTPSGGKKIQNHINLGNNEVDLSELFDLKSNEKAIYQVKAAVIHLGSLTNGHYYTLVEQGGTWFKCNDGFVDITNNPALELSKGYVYFLERKSE